MEVIEENSSDRHANESLKSHAVDNENTVAVAADLCQTSNGVDEIEKAGQLEDTVTDAGTKPNAIEGSEIPQNTAISKESTPDVVIEDTTHVDSPLTKDTSADVSDISNVIETVTVSPKDESINKDDVEVVTEVVISDEVDKTDNHDDDEIEVSISEVTADNIPKFKTEVVIEANDTGSIDDDGQNASKNILSEFGESIELSDVLRSDVTEISENNNGSVRQEVFNKEELLDILEGNDVETASVTVTEVKHVFKSPSKDIETKLALQQLSRLKREKNRYGGKLTSKFKKEKKYRTETKVINNIEGTLEKKKSNKTLPQEVEIETEKVTNNVTDSNKEKKTSNESNQSKNIVNVLVMDWDDDEQETAESDQPKESILEENENLLNETETPKENQESVASEQKSSSISTGNSVPTENHLNKERSGEENQPQRRLGRVIKKKVIFDPDNPDTFTKTKTKSKEPAKDPSVKEQPPVKKIKQEQTPPRSKSKSPMSNMQWKKPSSKNSKQNRRLTEVDRLLMDEGAVNMIYQLTPEAPKGKKSRETKAEFIKKIQSSTPDGKEMKFRERKTLKYEDGEAKKILGGKHRVSLNSSIKSPSVSEDFETHSADDSIIYRRHSSSSYSSSCMSPRRLSDVDSSSAQTNTRMSQLSSDSRSQNTHSSATSENVTDVFMSSTVDSPSTDIINKDDYLSIKEKLNSKLSLALNKRKRESIKNEKSKQKKVLRNDDKNETKSSSEELKHVTIKIDNRLVEISIQTIDLQYDAEILKEIAQALNFVNSIKDTSVTLLPDFCTICSNLDFKSLLVDDKLKRENNAVEYAEAISCVLQAVDRHSKLVCCGVQAECRGVALGVAALSDVVLASERASFSLGAPQPAAAALSARCRPPHPMVNELILFGRKLSASEALQGGLVSKVLWPERFVEQIYNIAKDIACQESPNVMLKKRLLGLNKSGESEQTFLSCLEAEREIFVEYWTSVQGQELLRAESN